jgi:hypothetical protein
MNFGLNKVIGDDESGFRGIHDRTYRIEAWDFVIAGGAIFDHLDRSVPGAVSIRALFGAGPAGSAHFFRETNWCASAPAGLP